MPFGLPFSSDHLAYRSDQDYETEVSLPADTIPHCRLQFDRRCLIALEPIMSSKWSSTRGAGTIRLAGQIERDGHVEIAETLADDITPVSAKKAVMELARQNFATWRFEPAETTEKLLLTYRFIVDEKMPQGKVTVDFEFPSAITVTGNPGP
jgi:hypothetical protein